MCNSFDKFKYSIPSTTKEDTGVAVPLRLGYEGLKSHFKEEGIFRLKSLTIKGCPSVRELVVHIMLSV